MEILNEKNIKMVSMDCRFDKDEIAMLREHYAKSTSDKQKEEIEVNWALSDILSKYIEAYETMKKKPNMKRKINELSD